MNDESSLSSTDTTSGSTPAPGVRPAVAEAGQAVKTAFSEVAGQTRQSVAKAADQVQRAGAQAVDATKAYAHDAVDAAGRRVRDAKTRFEAARTGATDYIHEDPVRAVKMAAIGGAVLSATLMLLTRRGR